MDDLLVPISTTYRKERTTESFTLHESKDQISNAKSSRSISLEKSSPEEVLETLKSQPNYDELISALSFLTNRKLTFSISTPSPLAAQIIQVLVEDIAQNYWALLKEGSTESREKTSRTTDLDLFLQCLRSLGGINALLFRLRVLIQESKAQAKGMKRTDIELNTGILLDLLQALLAGDVAVATLWASVVVDTNSSSKKRTLTQEFLSILAGGKLNSVAAEAESIIDTSRSDQSATSRWIGNGLEYSKWLGRNVAAWARTTAGSESTKTCADLLSRSFRLGYSDAVIRLLISDLLLRPASDAPTAFASLVEQLSHLDQRKVTFAVLKYLSENFLNSLPTSKSPADAKTSATISATAGVIERAIGSNSTRIGHLITWLTSASGAGVGDGVGIRRVVLAVVGRDKDLITEVLEKSISQFGDQLYIKHSPMLQQEAHTQVLLLSAGYAKRNNLLKLRMALKGSSYLNMVSNRIGTSQLRARILGMIVGEALSSLVEAADKRLDFKMDETSTEEAKWYKSLINVSDQVGPFDSLVSTPTQSATSESRHPSSSASRQPSARPKPKPPAKTPAKPTVPKPGFIIEEIDDSDEDDDIVPYAKPDSDAEDSDDDPTLITRNKPRAPVYVRDLLAYLRDVDNYNKQKLALAAAPALIRRKANFGTEVSSHAEDLARQFVGLQDKFDIDDFHALRLQSMLALVVGRPQEMGPWFARAFFDGDYSILQRASILAVLGLGARELAGFDALEYQDAAAFPSKRLPEKMEQLYIDGSSAQRLPSSSLKALPANALDRIADGLTAKFLAPLAAQAADDATGPDALKLSSFTSRLKSKNSSSVSAPKATPRLRSIPNTTASLISTSFFFPLTGRFQHALRSSASSRNGVVFEPYLLASYIKTLAVLVHAAGPSTLALPQLTAELWDLLLSVRGYAVGELSVTHAVLTAFAALLEVNEGRMREVCESMGREVVETQEWVAMVFHGTMGSRTEGEAAPPSEEDQVKMLAAGVLLRLQESVEKYRMLLMGDLMTTT